MLYIDDIKKHLINLLWPKILLPSIRETTKQNLYKISTQDRLSAMTSGLIKNNKIDPWAFIRVKDERRTLSASLNSILPAIHKGVIAYNDCTDGSDEIIKEFCLANPGFIPFHYPYYVEPAGSKKYATGHLKEENTLAGYYNAVLSFIPKNEWLIKIDVDQIFFPEILEHSFYLPESERDMVVYSRLDVIRDDRNELYVKSYRRPNDQWLIFNNDFHFVNDFGKLDSGRFYSWEVAVWKKKDRYFKPECSNIHFPYEKHYRKFNGNINSMPSLREYLKSANPDEFSGDLINIYNIIDTFDFSDMCKEEVQTPAD